MITPEDIRIRYDEFADTTEYPDNKIKMYIEDAMDDIGSTPSHWLTEYRYNRALSALSAHYIVLGEASSLGDTSSKYPIIQQTAGGVSVSYSGLAGASRTDFIKRLSSTTYGQEFLALRDRTFVGTLVVNQNGVGM